MPLSRTALGWAAITCIVHGSAFALAQPDGPRPEDPSARPRGGPIRFDFQMLLQRHDANGDGAVSRDEFPGPERFFTRMDADDDGLVTAQEFQLRRGGRERGGRGRGNRGRARFQDFPVAKPAPGDAAPQFELQDLSRRSVTLSHLLQTKPVVLEFGSFT